MIKIIGIGLACLDYLLQVPDLQTVSQGCRLEEYKVQGGGMASTAMVAVARLGGQAELWTALGQDQLGPQIEAELIEYGVDMSQTVWLPDAFNHVAFILVDGQTGERVFLKGRASQQFRFTEFTPDIEPDWSRIDTADVVHVDGLWNDLGYKGLQYARRKGIPTCGDIEYLHGNERLLPLIDYLIVPKEMAEDVTGTSDAAALEKLAQYGAKMVVITLGEAGSLYLVNGKVGEVPAFAVETIDTTGAGDVFHGAFIYGLAHGWLPRQMVIFASAVAALKCTQLGGRSGIPTLMQTQAFLSERNPDFHLE